MTLVSEKLFPESFIGVEGTLPLRSAVLKGLFKTAFHGESKGIFGAGEGKS